MRSVMAFAAGWSFAFGACSSHPVLVASYMVAGFAFMINWTMSKEPK